MATKIAEALASSSAHGISRAAATNSILLRVAWIIFFLCFLGLFCNSARILVDKLINVTYITTVEADKVPLKFPDIYICPTNPISGSYPYSLNETEAALVNEEIERLGKIYDSLEDSHEYKNISKANAVLNSVSPRVMKLFYLRQEQSLFFLDECQNKLNFDYVESVTRTIMYPSNHCFKLNLSKRLAEDLRMRALNNLRIQLCLFTDPYNPHFKYNGSQVKPIIHGNKSIPLEEWHLFLLNEEDATSLGYSLYLVPEGHFPSVSESTAVKLSPGHSYDIAIIMEDVVFSSELHGQNCTSVKDDLAVADPLTGTKIEYHSTLQGNIFVNIVRQFYQQGEFLLPTYPIPWDLRHGSPMYYLSDHSLLNISCEDILRIYATAKPYAHYLPLQPCHFQRYRVASLSSNRWPALFGNVNFKPSADRKHRPAIDRLFSVWRQLHSDPGNHSAHLELMMQNFIANSMLKVSIGAQSQMSPRIEISYSYSWTSFLSDIGGLLGLYIGCSMLTVCELFEIFYHLVFIFLKRWRDRNKPNNGLKFTAVATGDC